MLAGRLFHNLAPVIQKAIMFTGLCMKAMNSEPNFPPDLSGARLKETVKGLNWDLTPTLES